MSAFSISGFLSEPWARTSQRQCFSFFVPPSPVASLSRDCGTKADLRSTLIRFRPKALRLPRRLDRPSRSHPCGSILLCNFYFLRYLSPRCDPATIGLWSSEIGRWAIAAHKCAFRDSQITDHDSQFTSDGPRFTPLGIPKRKTLSNFLVFPVGIEYKRSRILPFPR
jgi:hypothetical protein